MLVIKGKNEGHGRSLSAAPERPPSPDSPATPYHSPVAGRPGIRRHDPGPERRGSRHRVGWLAAATLAAAATTAVVVAPATTPSANPGKATTAARPTTATSSAPSTITDPVPEVSTATAPAPPADTVPTGPVYYALDGLDRAWKLDSVRTSAGRSPEPGTWMHVYGHGEPEDVTLDATLAVITAAGRQPAVVPGLERPGAPITIRGVETTVHTDGQSRWVAWREPNGRAVTVFGSRVSEDAVVAMAVGVAMEADGAKATALPAGFREVYTGPLPGGPDAVAERITRQTWSGRGSVPGMVGFSLALYEGPGLSLDSLSWTLSDGRRSQVGGRPALVDLTAGTLSWQPRPGVLLVLRARLFARAVPENALEDLAALVTPVDEATWRRLVADVPEDPNARPGSPAPTTSTTTPRLIVA